MKRLMKQLIIAGVLLFVSVSSVSAESYPNRPIHWGFKKASDGIPAEAGQEWDDILKRHGAYYKGDPNKKDIYLTFDNGYENGYTEKVLNVLKKEKVPATFFVTGHYLETEPKLVKRMVKEGHIVGNHSWHHPDLTQVSDERLKEELEKVKEKTEELTGVKTMNYIRPPRGIFSERTMALANDEGYTHVFWSLAFKDWQTDQQKGAQYSYDNIMRQIHPGAVLLLHTVSKDNAEALESVIKDLKKQGYTFKSLDDLTKKNTKDRKTKKQKQKKKD
ncbi:delta-lactam-biosynthetic de-N-acetylase [Niallia endozanthoxylica]|uniref:Delta-lactam-biosynthetic de-N-acetylase n=1 Tax=Niallia endozanthoxylica TaxID=2036016 RepID=A0A5J5I6C1_9BACI|nr:delta-lactam-biosynthetic de-N-acetylase [Niallia endozanthoxylica]